MAGFKKKGHKKIKKQVKVAILCIVVICMGFGTAYYISVEQIKNKYRADIEVLNMQLDENKRKVYVALEDIPAGSPVIIGQGGNAELKICFSSQSMGHYMDQEQSGYIAAVDIPAGQPIQKNMLGEDLEFSLREQEFGMIRLSSNLAENDFVDIRMMYPNGENYVVLSKKSIRNLSHEFSDVFMWLNEEEIMLISSAIVDAYIHEGSLLYTTRYLDNAQEKSFVTYAPSKDVMIAMANDPNILEEARSALNLVIRQEMDTRIRAFEKDSSINLNQGTSRPYSKEEESPESAVDESLVYEEDLAND